MYKEIDMKWLVLIMLSPFLLMVLYWAATIAERFIRLWIASWYTIFGMDKKARRILSGRWIKFFVDDSYQCEQ